MKNNFHFYTQQLTDLVSVQYDNNILWLLHSDPRSCQCIHSIVLAVKGSLAVIRCYFNVFCGFVGKTECRI